MSYLNVIKIAVFIFPIICILLSLPFIIFHYRKYGTISFFRCIVLFSFFFYLLCIYFLVILPLPSKEAVSNYTSAFYNLRPFFIVRDVIVSGNFNISDPDTYIYLLNGKYFEPILNILMFIPFGIFLRYYFKSGFFKTVFLSFFLSLFFELTQLSGLYFLYSRPYRLFDINDLMNNSFGGLIGYLICPIVCFLLPSREKMDSSDYVRGNYVSVLRNGIALIIDYFILVLVSFGIMSFLGVGYFKMIYMVLVFLYFVFIPYFSSGYTFGKWFLKIRNIGVNDDNHISIFKHFFKWLFLHLFLINGWVLLLIFNNRVGYVCREVWLIYFNILFLFFVYCFSCLIIKRDIFINRILGIESVSFIQFDDEDDYEI